MEAQYQVACYFLEHGTKIDQEDAARYLTMAARQGHPRACLLLAKQQLDQGKLDEVAELLRNAADCGLWEAAELLGECYSQGIGMAQNPQEAERRFIQAAEWGGGEQMLRLALRYAKGNQVPTSRGRAFSWVKRAQETGVSDAKEQFDLQYAQYMEERRRLAQEDAERQAQEEAERQRLAQEEAERIAQEEAERSVWPRRKQSAWHRKKPSASAWHRRKLSARHRKRPVTRLKSRLSKWGRFKVQRFGWAHFCWFMWEFAVCTSY